MKKIFSIIFCLLFVSMVYSEIYEYVDESGRSFFYNKPKSWRAVDETKDQIEFINSQGFTCAVESYDPNYNREEMIKEVKRMYRDSILVLYNQNKDYMERNYPGNTYTFKEVYAFAIEMSDNMTWIGYDDIECCILMYLPIKDIITIRIEKLKKYPYILGYLYKEEKYYDGHKCRLKELSGIKIN